MGLVGWWVGGWVGGWMCGVERREVSGVEEVENVWGERMQVGCKDGWDADGMADHL